MPGIGLHFFDPAFLCPEGNDLELPAGLDAYDDFERFNAGDNVSGDTGGAGFAAAWRNDTADWGVVAYDIFEAYNVADAVNGLSGGGGFAANWVSR